jgi:hypothetical protein
MFVKQLQPSIVLFDRFMIEEQFGYALPKIVQMQFAF